MITHLGYCFLSLFNPVGIEMIITIWTWPNTINGFEVYQTYL